MILVYNMLISQEEVIVLLNKYNINVKGVFHVGAHNCEEHPFYKRIGIRDENMI